VEHHYLHLGFKDEFERGKISGRAEAIAELFEMLEDFYTIRMKDIDKDKQFVKAEERMRLMKQKSDRSRVI